ncbi:MAG: family 43 glycosylhydrolase [Acidobacteriota bacterium]|nr:family 43 glycosylhydrolase [Acidobacteriota bacterium]
MRLRPVPALRAATSLLAPLLAALLLAGPVALAQQQSSIHPGEVWNDNRGLPIQAHGGGILQRGKLYYWFGEDRSQGLDPALRYVGCYSSRDLVHWRFRRRIAFADPEGIGPNWILERPKVFYNNRTRKYVMYMHLDGPLHPSEHGYRLAKVGVAVSNRPDGPYHFVRSFRPLGHESRDIGQFVDDDGSAYLIFEDRPYGFRIAQLSADYLSVEREVALLPMHLEGGALVHWHGLYYVLGSHLSGWDPNPNLYATAEHLEGPWSEFRDLAPPAERTYGSQSTFLLKVTGSRASSVVFLGDIWKPKALWDSRYLWMPLQLGDGRMALPSPQPWSINIKTGETSLQR